MIRSGIPGALCLILTLGAAASVACRPRPAGASLKSEDAASQGPQQAETAGRAYPTADQPVTATLPVALTTMLRTYRSESHPALSCEPISSASVNTGWHCTLSDPEQTSLPVRDHLECYELYLESTPPAQIPAEARGSCTIVANGWPDVSRGLAQLLGSGLRRIAGGAAQTEYVAGSAKRLQCAEADGAWACHWEGFTGLSPVEIPFSLPPGMPEAVVESGAVDDFGAPLPTRDRDLRLRIGAETITLRSFRVSDADLTAYLAHLASTEPDLSGSVTDALADYRENNPAAIPAGCREGELKAILDYTGEGYKVVNRQLRQMRDGKLGDAPPTPGEAARMKAMISGINCARRGTAEVTARGARLTPEKLAKYVVGKTVLEQGFTSTTIGTSVLPEFQGNVTFYTIGARGADLSEFSTVNPETSAEGELLIRASTMFKVGARDTVRGRDHGQDVDITRIFLLQIK